MKDLEAQIKKQALATVMPMVQEPELLTVTTIKKKFVRQMTTLHITTSTPPFPWGELEVIGTVGTDDGEYLIVNHGNKLKKVARVDYVQAWVSKVGVAMRLESEDDEKLPSFSDLARRGNQAFDALPQLFAD